MDGLERGDEIKLFDLRIDFHRTKAQELALMRETDDSIRELKLLIVAFVECGVERIDFRMKERLHWAKSTEAMCRTQLKRDSQLTHELDQILVFLNKYGVGRTSVLESEGRIQSVDGKTYLKGIVSSLKPTFGFILGEDGGKYFFHFDTLKQKIKENRLQVGDKVLFKANVDPSGQRSASGIRLSNVW